MKTRRICQILVLICHVAVTARVVCAQGPSEFEVKAAFLLNFAKFVDWPEDRLQADAPIRICIVGDDPFGKTLDQLVEGETVETHRIVVERVRAPGDSACHIEYHGKQTKQALKAAAGVLTVGETDEFLRSGGMVAFIVENRRVRFDVSLTALRRSGVRASSRLLRVARTVKQ